MINYIAWYKEVDVAFEVNARAVFMHQDLISLAARDRVTHSHFPTMHFVIYTIYMQGKLPGIFHN